MATFCSNGSASQQIERLTKLQERLLEFHGTKSLLAREQRFLDKRNRRHNRNQTIKTFNDSIFSELLMLVIILAKEIAEQLFILSYNLRSCNITKSLENVTTNKRFCVDVTRIQNSFKLLVVNNR